MEIFWISFAECCLPVNSLIIFQVVLDLLLDLRILLLYVIYIFGLHN